MRILSRLFSRKYRSHFYIVLDIGTFSIRSVLVEKTAGQLMAFKKQVHFLPKRDDDSRLAQSVGERLQEVLLRYVKDLRRVPNNVIMGLASTVAFSKIETEKKVRPDANRIFEQKELDEILSTALTDKKEIAGENGKLFVLAHVEALHVSIDGYNIDLRGWHGIKGSEAEVSLAVTYLRNDFAVVLNQIRQALGGLPVIIRPAHISVTAAVARSKNISDFLLIKIGGRVTQISGVKDSLLQWTEALPIGGEYITDDIAKKLGVTLSHAEDIKRQYRTLIMTPEFARAAKTIIDSHIDRLKDFLRKTVITKQLLLPPTIFLYGGGARLQAVKEALSDKSWFKELTYAETIGVKTLEAEDLTRNIFTHAALYGPDDVELAALDLTALNT